MCRFGSRDGVAAGMVLKSQNVDKSAPQVLVVDLDGTLLRSDMLLESFWSAFGRDWRTLFRSAAALRNGRAALKRYLATNSVVEPETLPYAQSVLDYIDAWRNQRGGGNACNRQ